jgi:hypothetical protein
MIEQKNSKRAGIKRVPRPTVIDPNQRYSLAKTHAALAQSHVKTYQDIKRGTLQTIKERKSPPYCRHLQVIENCRDIASHPRRSALELDGIAKG